MFENADLERTIRILEKKTFKIFVLLFFKHTCLLGTSATQSVMTIWFQAQFLDVICLNRYYGWYHAFGKSSLIKSLLTADLQKYHEAFGKPIMITEYGAGSVVDYNEVGIYPLTSIVSPSFQKMGPSGFLQ